MKKIILPLVLLWTVLLSSPTFSSPFPTQASPDTPVIVWIVDSPVRANSFPVLVYGSEYYFNTPLESLEITTSWNASYTYVNSSSTVYWIDRPSDTGLSGNVSITVNGNLTKEFPVIWAPVIQIDSLPVDITLDYHFFSYWAGQAVYNSSFHRNGSYTISNEAESYHGWNSYSYGPYNESFEFAGTTDFTELFAGINLTDTYSFQSWEITSSPGLCDGGGYEISLNLFYEDGTTVKVEKIRDNDTCTGRTTLISAGASDFVSRVKGVVFNFTDALLNESEGPDVTSSRQGSPSPVDAIQTDLPLGEPAVFMMYVAVLSAYRASRRRGSHYINENV